SLSSPPEPRTSSPAADEFVADWDIVQSGGYWTFDCGGSGTNLTFLVSSATYLSSCDYESGTFVKYEQGASLEVDGAVYYNQYNECPGQQIILTSINDNDPNHGQVIDGSSGEHDDHGDYGPALITCCDQLPAAGQTLSILYAPP